VLSSYSYGIAPHWNSENAERQVQNDTSRFLFTVIQGKTRARARLVKLQDAVALIVSDRILTIGKRLLLVRAATESDRPKTNRLVQVHATVEKGDDEKRGYVLRLLHAQCPAGLDVLLAFLQKELGLAKQDPELAEAADGESGPVTYRFDSRSFEMGGANLKEERNEPRPVYRATPAPRRTPIVQEVATYAPEARLAPPLDQQMPDAEENTEEFFSLLGVKAKPGKVNRQHGEDDDESVGKGKKKKKKKKTGVLKRVVRRLEDISRK